ncbi:MAG TPA: YciI family protein [Longimicrobium sp.]|nr:YciI family protein [Longimicrobium sp.]
MRFITLVKGCGTQGPPPPSFLEAIARGRDEAVAQGRLIATGGLSPLAAGDRLRVAGGRVLDGPFAEAKEVIGGYGVVEAASREEALESARWLMQLHAEHWPGWEGEVEVRQLFPDPAVPQPGGAGAELAHA